MSGDRPAREFADGPSGGPAIAWLRGDRLATFGLRRMVLPYADRVRVVDRPSVADLVLVDPLLPTADEIDVVDLAERSAGGLVVYTWGSLSGAAGPFQLRAAGWPLRGWLSKALPPEDLVRALERIHRGEWVHRDVPVPAQGPLDSARAASTLVRLTPRESQIVSLIGQGLTNHQIADESYLSINSVKAYIRSAYRKMGVATRTHAVLWAVRNDRDGVARRSPRAIDQE